MFYETQKVIIRQKLEVEKHVNSNTSHTFQVIERKTEMFLLFTWEYEISCRLKLFPTKIGEFWLEIFIYFFLFCFVFWDFGCDTYCSM